MGCVNSSSAKSLVAPANVPQGDMDHGVKENNISLVVMQIQSDVDDCSTAASEALGPAPAAVPIAEATVEDMAEYQTVFAETVHVIENEGELAMSTRGMTSCGCCAAETDVRKSICGHLFDLTCHSDAGCFWCSCIDNNRDLSTQMEILEPSVESASPLVGGLAHSNSADSIVLENEGELVIGKRDMATCGCCAVATDVRKSICGHLFDFTCHSNAGCFWCNCGGTRRDLSNEVGILQPSIKVVTPTLDGLAGSRFADTIVVENEEELVIGKRGLASCGCCAVEHDVRKSICGHLFDFTCHSDAGCLWCNCRDTHRDLSIDVAVPERAEPIMGLSSNPAASWTEPPMGSSKVILDESDTVQVDEEEESCVRPRSAGGCGCCAEQTDVTANFLCGLVSFDVHSNAGVSYCRC